MGTQQPICKRRVQYCAGHRLPGHEGKCRSIHGHNYVAHIYAEGKLDAVGRVVDFSVLKERVGGWIEDHWDHGFVRASQDEVMRTVFTHLLQADPSIASKHYERWRRRRTASRSRRWTWTTRSRARSPG